MKIDEITRKKMLKKMQDVWEVDVTRSEIRRKKRKPIRKFIDFITWKRYSVNELYIFVYEEFHREDRIDLLMPFTFPMEHDGIKKPPTVLTIFQLSGGWKINPRDLKVLEQGPLISEDGEKILVEAQVRWNQVKEISKKVFGIIVWLLGFVATIIALFEAYQKYAN